MKRMYDFECSACHYEFEDLVPNGDKTTVCPKCSGSADRIYATAPVLFTTIVADYPGSKKIKAGYQHTHADRPATKVQGRGWSAN